MEDGNRRDSGDAFAVQLGKLVTGSAVDIHEPVHVADAEALDVRLRIQLPMRSKTESKVLACFFLNKQYHELTW